MDKTLTQPMMKTLRNLYRHYKFSEPFVPQEGRGIRSSRSMKALVRRGLAREIQDNRYVITRQGIEYCQQSEDIAIPMISERDIQSDPILARAVHVFDDYKQRRDLGLWAGYFQLRAQKLLNKSISNWDKGGWIEDEKTYRLAQVYEFMAILAWEQLDEQTAS